MLQKTKCFSKKHHQKAAIVVFRRYHSKRNPYVSSIANNKRKNIFSADHGSLNFSNSFMQVRFYSLPPHTKIVLPALSPTMEMGTIVQWQVKEGDRFEPGDLLADIETDKATMGFEAIEEGYIAKILVTDGAKDIPLGTLVAISVENEEDLAAFKGVSAGINSLYFISWWQNLFFLLQS